MANSRIYIVTGQGAERLIRATSLPAAIGYCSRGLFKARVARPVDLTEALVKGSKVEDALEPEQGGGE
jgi:hypothetical protein